jgi:hypothetical protein
MSTDVLIDMSGFALGIVICLPFALIGALIGGRHRGAR